MFGVSAQPSELVFHVLPCNREIWLIANELRGHFDPPVVIQYLGQILPREQFRETYRHMMMFADAAMTEIRKNLK